MISSLIPDEWRPADRYIAECKRCGREMLKKHMIALLVRAGSAVPVTFCHFCPECWVSFAEELETQNEVNYGGYA